MEIHWYADVLIILFKVFERYILLFFPAWRSIRQGDDAWSMDCIKQRIPVAANYVGKQVEGFLTASGSTHVFNAFESCHFGSKYFLFIESHIKRSSSANVVGRWCIPEIPSDKPRMSELVFFFFKKKSGVNVDKLPVTIKMLLSALPMSKTLAYRPPGQIVRSVRSQIDPCNGRPMGIPEDAHSTKTFYQSCEY